MEISFFAAGAVVRPRGERIKKARRRLPAGLFLEGVMD